MLTHTHTQPSAPVNKKITFKNQASGTAGNWHPEQDIRNQAESSEHEQGLETRLQELLASQAGPKRPVFSN
jgi:hypothetical protein